MSKDWNEMKLNIDNDFTGKCKGNLREFYLYCWNGLLKIYDRKGKIKYKKARCSLLAAREGQASVVIRTMVDPYPNRRPMSIPSRDWLGNVSLSFGGPFPRPKKLTTVECDLRQLKWLSATGTDEFIVES